MVPTYPVPLTVVSDCYGNSKVLQALRNHAFIHFISPAEFDPEESHGRVLIYGYVLAKQIYDTISINDSFINEDTHWSFNEFESPDDVFIEEWINEQLTEFFEYTSEPGKFGQALLDQLAHITDPVFVFVGNHEVYLLDWSNKTVYSWSEEEISYREDKSMHAHAAAITNHFLVNKIQVYAWSSENLRTLDHDLAGIIINITDVVYTWSGTWMDPAEVKSFFKTWRKLTTPEMMIYVSRVPHLWIKLDTKDYMRRLQAGDLDQLYSRASIFFDRDNLLAKIKQRNQSGVDAKALEKVYSILDTDSMVRVPYNSRNKITGRMFPAGGDLNPITMSDPDLLASVKSRHGGLIVKFDFEQFEPRIITHVCDLPIKGDIHQKAADVLAIDRPTAKTLNNMIMYGTGEEAFVREITAHKIGSAEVERYLQMMEPTVARIDYIRQVLLGQFREHGYFRNPFGRIIRPRSEAGVFNNYIQSTASEIFNEASWKVFKLLHDRKSELFMHRFDALYVDIHPNETELVELILNLLRTGLQIEFDVTVAAGKNLADLKVL